MNDVNLAKVHTEPSLEQSTNVIQQLQDTMNARVIGQKTVVKEVLMALLSNGHVLLEGVQVWERLCW